MIIKISYITHVRTWPFKNVCFKTYVYGIDHIALIIKKDRE